MTAATLNGDPRPALARREVLTDWGALIGHVIRHDRHWEAVSGIIPGRPWQLARTFATEAEAEAWVKGCAA